MFNKVQMRWKPGWPEENHLGNKSQNLLGVGEYNISCVNGGEERMTENMEDQESLQVKYLNSPCSLFNLL